MEGLKLKVCGMRDSENITKLINQVNPDFIGFIFYEKSKRFVENTAALNVNGPTQKVGVFVNAAVDVMLDKARKFDLHLVQLHGEEPVAVVRELKAHGIKVIKVFAIDSVFPVEKMEPYVGHVDYFLFDTKTENFGGSGKKFDWSLLKNYPFSVPFFLSGGINSDDLKAIRSLKIPALYALDINSRFELEPGLKDIDKVKEFKEGL